VRESGRRITAELDEKRRRHEEVMRSIEFGRGKSADEIRRLILDEYALRGFEPPTDFAWASRFIAAASARHGRRTRLLVVTARGYRAARKWLATTRLSAESDPPGDEAP
jgi:hypothetical protein